MEENVRSALSPYHSVKTQLRAELKSWERAFERENGRKPSAADVKANPDISTKYKTYHKTFRTKCVTHQENVREKIQYISSASALKQITPRKPQQYTDLNMITPLKSKTINIDLESVGPTPQLNGRLLGLFDGIQDNTPPWKTTTPLRQPRQKMTRTGTTVKMTPEKEDEFWEDGSQTEETPTKSASSIRTRYTTPVTSASPTTSSHGFATPAFLRPKAPSVRSPQSPSLPWEKIPSNIKGLSALISDFKANQHQISDEEQVQFTEFQNEIGDSLMSGDEGADIPLKIWTKKGAKRTTRRIRMRPVHQLEIPPSDDEPHDGHAVLQTTRSPCLSPKMHLDDNSHTSDGELPEQAGEHSKARNDNKRISKKAAGYRKATQVSSNFVSYKLRKKGHGTSKFHSRRFRKR